MFWNESVQNNLQFKVSFCHYRYFLVVLILLLKRQITYKIQLNILKPFNCHVIGSFKKHYNVFKWFF